MLIPCTSLSTFSSSAWTSGVSSLGSIIAGIKCELSEKKESTDRERERMGRIFHTFVPFWYFYVFVSFFAFLASALVNFFAFLAFSILFPIASYWSSSSPALVSRRAPEP